MLVVGLTGGIASGKSYVSGYIKIKKIPVHESDVVVSQLYKTNDKKFVSFLMRSGFKDCVYKKKINKKHIKDIFFKDNKKKIILENYLHRQVKKERDLFLKKNKNKKIVALDIPLLFEKKLEEICDIICSTIATKKQREKRALLRPGMKKTIFEKILKNQVSDKIRKEKSDYLIYTNKTKKETHLQVDRIIYDIKSKLKK